MVADGYILLNNTLTGPLGLRNGGKKLSEINITSVENVRFKKGAHHNDDAHKVLSTLISSAAGARSVRVHVSVTQNGVDLWTYAQDLNIATVVVKRQGFYEVSHYVCVNNLLSAAITSIFVQVIIKAEDAINKGWWPLTNYRAQVNQPQGVPHIMIAGVPIPHYVCKMPNYGYPVKNGRRHGANRR